MKYLLSIFCFFLVLFLAYAVLVIVKSEEGVFDICICNFESCVLSEEENTYKAVRVFKCSNKAFLCNVRSLYYSFVDEKVLDKEYNDYFMDKLKEEITEEDELSEQEVGKTDEIYESSSDTEKEQVKDPSDIKETEQAVTEKPAE